MRAFAALLLAIASLSVTSMSIDHPVPTNRQELKGEDWFPYVMSKIAPLEWWSFSSSTKDVKRDDYPSDSASEVAKNTWEFPRFCFSFFRPKPEVFASLLSTVNRYSGDVFWEMHDNCIGAFPARPTYYAPMDFEELKKQMQEAIENPPRADPEFVKKAMNDIPHFCQYLETHLGLKEKPSQQFQTQWLTKEGLREHPREDTDFIEYGSWSVALTKSPQALIPPSSTAPADALFLGSGLSMNEADSIFKELGADWTKFKEGDTTAALLPEYPMLARLDDDTADVTYSADEVVALLNECVRAQNLSKASSSIRGLDKLIRITKWAERLQVGLYFGGQ